jgi:hypothetical protein
LPNERPKLQLADKNAENMTLAYSERNVEPKTNENLATVKARSVTLMGPPAPGSSVKRRVERF